VLTVFLSPTKSPIPAAHPPPPPDRFLITRAPLHTSDTHLSWLRLELKQKFTILYFRKNFISTFRENSLRKVTKEQKKLQNFSRKHSRKCKIHWIFHEAGSFSFFRPLEKESLFHTFLILKFLISPLRTALDRTLRTGQQAGQPG
jgi:hypothetical protein